MASLIVVFKEANEKYAKPEMFVCDANEAHAIQALLETVGEERNGPIERLPYVEFVEEARMITLAELRERFAQESEEAEEEAVNFERVWAVPN
jgi:hypothetical protein